MFRLVNFIFIVSFLFLISCSLAPVTGRKQIILISPSEENSLGLSEAQSILKNSKQTSNKQLADRVSRIGRKIAAASESQDSDWNFYVLEDDVVNAFALPGRKVFFYTGILKLMSNDDQIATVMGHEIAHVLARHGAERISQQMLSGAGSQILASSLNVASTPKNKALFEAVYGAASNVGVILPFSRKHESEADTIGIYLMYKAGYNPNEAVNFWRKMALQGGGSKLEFLSTHPSDEKRIKDISDYIKTLKR
jgi:predicted Zn-dependent protease